MNKIKEIILEPSTVYVGSFFNLKVKVDRHFAKKIVTTNGRPMMTINNKQLVTMGVKK